MRNFFQKNNKNSSGLLSRIEAACKGLVYISETDSPLVPFAGGQTDIVTREIILQEIGGEEDAAVDEVDFGAFFTKLTAAKDWFGEPEKVRAKKFLNLQMLLEENLRQRKVFRIGKIRLDIYVVGIDIEGNLIGVTTKAVET